MARRDEERSDLAELAALRGVLTRYDAGDGRIVEAEPEALLAVLGSLGAPVEVPRDLRDAVREARSAAFARALPPVLLLGEGRTLSFRIRLAAREAAGPMEALLESCDPEGPGAGGTLRAAVDVGAVRRRGAGRGDGVERVDLEIDLPWIPEVGYHRLTIATGSREVSARLLVAPQRVPAPPERSWGAFLPLYSAWRRGGTGIGTFTDLGELAAWVGRLGGSFLGTLPLMAALDGRRDGWSPYAPASRLFLNEIYIDPEAVPDLAGCQEARRLLAEASAAAGTFAGDERVDYERILVTKRRILDPLAASVAEGSSERARRLEEWVRGRPELEDYARFRAAGERFGGAWTEWPEAMRDGAIPADAVDPNAVRYHRYVQWIAAEQMDAAARKARAAGSSLYLDLPLGVHPEGYDAWRYQSLFAEGATAGAPPDAFFTGGQSWGFRPLHPERLREDGYGYLARGLRAAMARAGMARIDHVMAFHRLFWVPEGMRPTDGVYVNYPVEEMYAVLAIEAQRASCAVVGEDLGTVPGEVREEMFRRSLLRMHVLQIEIEGAEGPSPPEAAPWSLASLNTHDMPPFAAFWRGLDLEDRFDLGLCDAEGLRREQARREDVRRTLLRILRGGGWLGEDESEVAVLAGCLKMLSSGPSRLLQINLEDLWLEDRPQNVPGTSSERPNWLRRSRLAVEEILDSQRVKAALESVGALRTRGDVTE